MLFSVFLLFWAPWGKTPDSCYLHSFPRKCLWNDLDVLTVLSRCFPGPSPEPYISKVACVLAASSLIAHHRQQRGFKMLPKCQQNKLHADGIELNLMLPLTSQGWLIKVLGFDFLFPVWIINTETISIARKKTVKYLSETDVRQFVTAWFLFLLGKTSAAVMQ